MSYDCACVIEALCLCDYACVIEAMSYDCACVIEVMSWSETQSHQARTHRTLMMKLRLMDLQLQNMYGMPLIQ